MDFLNDIASGGIFAQDDVVVLTRISDSDYSDFEMHEMEDPLYKGLVSVMDHSKLMSILWEGLHNEKNFVCAVRKSKDNDYCGYCEMKNTADDEPELGIELLKKVHNQGIGFRSLKLFMSEYAKLSGKKYFISKVDPQNYASQRLMEKLGGKPYGICEFIIHKEEEKLALEKKNAHLIDDRLICLAEKFNVKPEKLLSHVLRYRIEVV